jgi:competence protein ComEA
MVSKISVFLGSMLISISVLASPVNVNKASAEEIAIALKGVGPSKAQAISSYCKETKCSKAEDLLNVKGIGEKTLEKIKSDLLF